MNSPTVYYFDTSAILSMLLHQPMAAEALNRWEKCTHRVSSLLTYFECVVVAKRYGLSLPERGKADWQKQSEAWIERAMRSMSLYEVNQTVLHCLQHNEVFSRARTLDAIHLSTLIVFRQSGCDVGLVTFDDRMHRLAIEAGIKVVE